METNVSKMMHEYFVKLLANENKIRIRARIPNLVIFLLYFPNTIPSSVFFGL